MSRKTIIKILIVLLLLLAIAFAFFKGKTYIESNPESQNLVTKSKIIGPYIISEEQTDYQKNVDPLLESALSTEKGVNIVTEVSKYFISDFFTLREKKNFDSVGGMGFIYPSTQAQFKVVQGEKYYKDFEEHKKEFGQDKLPMVDDVKVGKPVRKQLSIIKNDSNDVSKIKMVFDVPVDWTYEKTDKSYDGKFIKNTVLRFVLVSDNNWYIYNMEGSE